MFSRLLTFLALVFLVAPLANAQVVQDQRTKKTKANSATSEIRAAIEGYVSAVNRGDVKAAADFWSNSGEWINSDGRRLVGKKIIQGELETIAAKARGKKIEVFDISIRLLAPTVAVEEGRARVVGANVEPNEASYVAIHVNKNGSWKLESLRETAAVPQTSHDHLVALEWMIGDWVDKDGERQLKRVADGRPMGVS